MSDQARGPEGAGPAVLRRGLVHLPPDHSRVIVCPFLPGQELRVHGLSRAESVIERLLAITEEDVSQTLAATLATFSHRHPDLRKVLREHFELVAHWLPPGQAGELSADRAELIGAYLTKEYAVEGAALFNPSIVAHPDQDGLAAGEVRFILSLRAVGEGHLSCVEFRTGVVGEHDEIRIDPPGPHLSGGRTTPNPMSTDLLRASLLGHPDAYLAESVLRLLPPVFTPQELAEVLHRIQRDHRHVNGAATLLDWIRRIAATSYRLEFPPERALSERVVLPNSPAESHGIEDVRFVEFVDDNGAVTFYGTYTAFDGVRIAPYLLRTDDFQTFDMTPMLGPAAQNKGMALFPRRIGGEIWSMSRWDGESLSVASSTDGVVWGPPKTVQTPRQPWELIQLGVCAPPVETSQGWLVLTHGVGPMRVYGLGALLLDLDDPAHVLGVLDEPLMTPDATERDGYVPNVLYSCGALVHGNTLVLPYGCSDSSIRVAFLDVAALLQRLEAARSVPPG